MMLFGMDSWEAKIFVLIIWAVTFLVQLGVMAALS
jgi:hypothetical protein